MALELCSMTIDRALHFVLQTPAFSSTTRVSAENMTKAALARALAVAAVADIIAKKGCYDGD